MWWAVCSLFSVPSLGPSPSPVDPEGESETAGTAAEGSLTPALAGTQPSTFVPFSVSVQTGDLHGGIAVGRREFWTSAVSKLSVLKCFCSAAQNCPVRKLNFGKIFDFVLSH